MKLCTAEPLFVTLRVTFRPMLSVGNVIALSLMLTSVTPLVGGFRLDFDFATSNVLIIPCSRCDLPSGAGTKHSMP